MGFMPIKNINICFDLGPKVESNMRILSPDSHQMTMDRGSVYHSHTRKTNEPICLPRLCDSRVEKEISSLSPQRGLAA